MTVLYYLQFVDEVTARSHGTKVHFQLVTQDLDERRAPAMSTRNKIEPVTEIILYWRITLIISG